MDKVDSVIRLYLGDDALTLARWGIGDDGTSVLYEQDDDELRAALAALLAENRTVPWEAFVALMAEGLESEGSKGDPEEQSEMWLDFWDAKRAARA